HAQKIHCTLDGRWELFEYDFKSKTITHTLRRRTNEQHTLQVMVYDQAGNQAQETYMITF
ncbi:MAG: hypothetical protein RLZZ165_779, partial [Bacteroidota bacterium]